MADEPEPEPEPTFTEMWQVSDRERHHGGGRVEMRTQIQILTQRNYELTRLVTTLVDVLAMAGHVDPNVLLGLVEGQLGPSVAETPPAGAFAPGTPTTHCARCGTEIARAAAEMTPSGLMCARCAVGG